VVPPIANIHQMFQEDGKWAAIEKLSWGGSRPVASEGQGGNAPPKLKLCPPPLLNCVGQQIKQNVGLLFLFPGHKILCSDTQNVQ